MTPQIRQSAPLAAKWLGYPLKEYVQPVIAPRKQNIDVLDRLQPEIRSFYEKKLEKMSVHNVAATLLQMQTRYERLDELPDSFTSHDVHDMFYSTATSRSSASQFIRSCAADKLIAPTGNLLKGRAEFAKVK